MAHTLFKFKWLLLFALNPSYLYNQRNLFLLSWEESFHFPIHKKEKKNSSFFKIETSHHGILLSH